MANILIWDKILYEMSPTQKYTLKILISPRVYEIFALKADTVKIYRKMVNFSFFKNAKSHKFFCVKQIVA